MSRQSARIRLRIAKIKRAIIQKVEVRTEGYDLVDKELEKGSSTFPSGQTLRVRVMEQPNQVRAEQFESRTNNTAFLPDLCTPSSVLSLVLLGELLALAFTIIKSGLIGFDWARFGIVSFLVQWIILSSAGSLCPLRESLNKMQPTYAFLCSYAVVLMYTIVFSIVGYWFFLGWERFAFVDILANTLIAAIFAGILLRYLYLQSRLSQKEKSEADARLIALQSRIRPHFLFNSLNSIASLIDLNPNQAEKTVLNLSRLFRASLSLPSLIPIEKELELCRSFVEIEQLRLGDRLTIDWKVADLPSNIKVLSLMIQPLVENAIYHGIQPSEKPGTVTVEIKPVEKDVVVKVSNPFLVGALKANESGNDRSDGAGIALANIRKRLEASYGRKAYLRVVKGETDFNVIVRYPALP